MGLEGDGGDLSPAGQISHVSAGRESREGGREDGRKRKRGSIARER